MSKQYSFLQEGPIGDNLRIKVAHALYKNPNKGDPFLFWQNVQGLRDRYAHLLKTGQATRKELLKRTEDAITRYEQEHGRLPANFNPFKFREIPAEHQLVANWN